MKQLLATCALALILSGCSDGVSGSKGEGTPLSAQDCDAIVRKGWELKNVPLEAQMPDPNFRASYDKTVHDCVKNQSYSRKQFECLTKSTSLDDYQGCGGGNNAS
ncbi:MAG TPA: hypothetical protein VK660_01380 [Xanthomonadaceae bacterium]|jgi:PBP1b-binding outer membrane lipoprotein LpoB|nr:hypothetical protein [Xanthomonadaceae bacterium]